MQQPSATLMQMIVTFSAVCVAGAAVTFTVHTWTSSRDAQLVQIGVSILEIDPQKQQQVAAAREWALNLIETNSGGVTFSPEARTQLLRGQLVASGYTQFGGGTFSGYTQSGGVGGSFTPSGITGSSGTPSGITGPRH